MNAERLLQLYDRVSEAPDAVPRLRRFILDLAVRGKLVEQDPNDEPASAYLKKISAEERSVGKKRRSRGSTSRPNDGASAQEFHELPETWAWTEIGDVFFYDAGIKRAPKDIDQGLWLLELEDVEKDTGRLINRLQVGDRESKSTKSEFRVGDILYGKLRPYLNKVLVADEPGVSTTEIVAIRPILPMCSAYCALAFRRPGFVEYVTRLGQGTKMPRLRTEDAIVAPFPLPPVPEQHRIVAKVDELIALCDSLEAERERREATRDRLTTASLSHLTAPDVDDRQFNAHADFAIKVLPELTTRPDQIKVLRQTILDLAVRGKLVEQDPNDEPAGEFLKKLTSDRAKAQKTIDLVTFIGASTLIPESWIWIPLGHLISKMDAGWSPQCESRSVENEKEWGVLKTTAVQALDFDARQNKRLPPKLRPRPEHEPSVGDILVTRAGPKNRVGVSCVVDIPCPRLMISDKLIRFRLLEGLSPYYVALALNAGYTFEKLEVAKSGMAVMQMNISQAKLSAVPIPLPPLAEQKRIVAKVDALLAQCGDLEQRLSSRRATTARLLEALLRRALEPLVSEAA